MVMRPRQCATCLMWGAFSLTRGECAGCAKWARLRPERDVCRKCSRMRAVDGDSLCRACVIAVRDDVEAGRDVVFPSPTQLTLMVPVHGRQRGRVLPRQVRGASQPQLGRPAVAGNDDPRVCPPVLNGQRVLFPAQWRLSRADTRRIAGRRWPEEQFLAPRVDELAVRAGLSDTWRAMVMRRLRCALALRDNDGEDLVAEELLDQVALPLGNVAREILDRAGLLRPRTRPPPALWPVRACDHCESWGITTTLCQGCPLWHNDPVAYPVGTCRRCARESLPLRRGYGTCRGCSALVHERGQELAVLPVTQLPLGGPLAHRVNRRSSQLGLGRPDGGEEPPGTPPRVVFSPYLIDPRQECLFTVDRDWSPVLDPVRQPLPDLTPAAEAVMTALEKSLPSYAKGSQGGSRSTSAVLRTVLAWLGADAPVRESDVRAVAGLTASAKPSARRILWFLDEQGLLIEEPHDRSRLDAAWEGRAPGLTVARLEADRGNLRHELALAAKLSGLPVAMAEQLHAWVLVMRGKGRRRHPAVDYSRIRRYLGIAWPVLSEWAAAGLDLRQITSEQITSSLDARTASSARAVHNVLNSIFPALQQQRAIFHNPMSGLSLTTPVRLPVPLPSDQLSGILDRLSGPAPRLTVALVAIHGLRVADISRLLLADTDRDRRVLTVRSTNSARLVHLDDLTAELLDAWLRQRRGRWPGTGNPHLIISQQTALHPAGIGVSYFYLRAAFDQIGLLPRKVWSDRVLYEAKQAADPVHLIRLFGSHPCTAVKYVNAAHPDKALPRIR